MFLAEDMSARLLIKCFLSRWVNSKEGDLAVCLGNVRPHPAAPLLELAVS